MKKKMPKKKTGRSKGRLILLITLIVVLGILGFLIKNKFPKEKKTEEVEANVLYSGIYESKKVYFIKEKGSLPIYTKDNDTAENKIKELDVKLIKSKKEVYRTEKNILWTNGYVGKDYLFMTINAENKNILLKMDLKTSKVEELIKEDGVAFYSFMVDQVVDKYLVAIYVPAYSEGYLGNRFIINLENNKKIIIEKDNIASDIKIDLDRKKAVWNKVKKEYVNCDGNIKAFPLGCGGMYAEEHKYFHFIPTEEFVEVSLP